jgi:hypothetical protein
VMEAMVARASSGVMSGAMTVSPNTWTSRVRPAMAQGFELVAAVVPHADVEALPRGGLPRSLGLALQLVAGGRAGEVGPVTAEALLDKDVDAAEIRAAEVDRDRLAVRAPGPELLYVTYRPWPCNCHPHG